MQNEQTSPAQPVAQPVVSLFRKEVLAAHDSQWMGAIRLAQPMSTKIVAAVSITIAACLLIYIFVGTVTGKARVTGITIPTGGSLTITAPNQGVLARSHVKEGQFVRAGQPLFELSTERQGSGGEITALVAQQIAIRGETLEAERRMRISQSAEKRATLDQSLANVVAEISQLQQELDVVERRKNLARETVAKYEVLQNNGFVSAAQKQQKQEELLDVGLRAGVLARSKLQLEARRISLESEKATIAADLANTLSQLRRSEASLGQEKAENQSRKTNIVLAPQSGMVTTITYQPGQAVTAGQTLAALLPQAEENSKAKAELEVQLYVPSRQAGFVASGQEVLIRYQAFPYQKFGLQRGTVVDISRTPFAPNELPQQLASTILSNMRSATPGGANTSEALYRIRVKLQQQSILAYGTPQALQPGMTLDADIVQDHRKIWEWIAEPLMAALQR